MPNALTCPAVRELEIAELKRSCESLLRRFLGFDPGPVLIFRSGHGDPAPVTGGTFGPNSSFVLQFSVDDAETSAAPLRLKPLDAEIAGVRGPEFYILVPRDILGCALAASIAVALAGPDQEIMDGEVFLHGSARGESFVNALEAQESFNSLDDALTSFHSRVVYPDAIVDFRRLATNGGAREVRGS